MAMVQRIRDIALRIASMSAVVAHVVSLSACQGTVSNINGIDDRPAGDGTTTPTAPGQPGSTCGEQQLITRRIIKLADRHYSNSVRALLGNEVIGTDFRSPSGVPSAFVEDLSKQPVGEALASQYETEAEAIAAKAMAQSGRLLPCPATTKQADACVRGWLQKFVARAYRRPVTSDELAAFATVFEAGASENAAGGLKLVVEAVLQSPSFLYRTELGGSALAGKTQLTSYETASQIAFWLIDAPPDDELWTAAQNGSLDDATTVKTQVDRLMQLPQTQARLTQAYLRWSGLSEFSTQTKDPALFPKFNDQRASLFESAKQLLSSTLFEGNRDMLRMYNANTAAVDQNTAPLFGVPAPSTPGLVKVQLPAERPGLFTHPAFLAHHASEAEGKIVQRGAFVSRFALCLRLDGPPPGLDIIGPGKGLSDRQFADYRASNKSCQGCHAIMDPYGLMLTAFDAVGRYEPTKNGMTVVTKATPKNTDFDVELSGPVELAEKVSTSGVAAGCFVRQMQSLASALPVTQEESCAQQAIESAFVAGGRDIFTLVRELAVSDSFRFRQP